jgi:hypothetical protein
MKVYVVFTNIFNGCDNFESVHSIHETEESAEAQQLLLEEEKDKRPDKSYFIQKFELQNIKL